MNEKVIEAIARALAWDHHGNYDNWQEWREAAIDCINAVFEVGYLIVKNPE